MKDRGKAVEAYNGNICSSDFTYSSSDLIPCKKHPSSSSSTGICAYCLKDRLIKLVCSDCGEQRLSSCSCSDVSSYRNSSCTVVEVGSVGRISFLIENDQKIETPHSHSKPKKGEIRTEEGVAVLKRSTSCCVEVKRSNGFWRIGRLFRRKRDKGDGFERSVGGVSRSRSLCSFRGGGFVDPDEENGVLNSENGVDLNEVKKVGLLELDSASNFPKRIVFPVKESDFRGMDESGFIDLKLDLLTESKPEFSALNTSDLPISVSDLHEHGGSFGSLKGGDGLFGNGGSCRITVNDRGIEKGSKGQKVWKWIFRHHHGWRSATKKHENHILKP